MFRLVSKLSSLKKLIRDFSRSRFSNLELRVQEAQVEMIECQRRTLDLPSTANASAELIAQEKWRTLAKAEESFLLQKSRILWLKDGDSNSRYFHRVVNARKSSSHIPFLHNNRGDKVDSVKGIQDICISYFSDLLGEEQAPRLFEQSNLSSLLSFNCSEEQKAELSKPFSEQEIKDCFFSLPWNKTGGPDGFSSEFFTSCWDIVGGEATAAVREFFSSGKMLRNLNATSLVLIPKVVNANSPADFRPISCLNTVYKVISRLLSNRLEYLLPQVIGNSQTAFLAGRLLAENVLLATEIVNGYGRKNITPKGMLKVDLRKAFDSVRWDFVLAAVRGLSVPEKFISWIAECITTVSFLVVVNGTTGGYFQSKQGLRQGDPLSPYLFVLVMEVFSALLKARYDSNYINYHAKTSSVEISHLIFADDVMIFYDGSGSSLHGITETMDDFAAWSGLHINREKSDLFVDGLNDQELYQIDQYEFNRASLPIRYLGLPLMSRRLKNAEFEPLLSKIKSKLNSWTVKSLSFSGRAQLFASVISGIVVFWIITFKILAGCIQQIESLCSRFLWTGNLELHSKAKVSWANVCLPKSEGGLGLRHLSTWNTTLNLKLIWLLFSGSASLWVAWHKEHHCATPTKFWSCNPKPSDSWTWKSLLKLRDTASKFLKCKLGHGAKSSFWYDSWSPLGPLINALGQEGTVALRIPISANVCDAVRGNIWILPHPRSDVEIALHAHLSIITLPLDQRLHDEYEWTVSSGKCKGFSSTKTWHDLRSQADKQPLFKAVWFKGSTPKHTFNMWICQLNRLRTRSRLCSWGLQITDSCCLCSATGETRDHLLLACPFATEI